MQRVRVTAFNSEASFSYLGIRAKMLSFNNETYIYLFICNLKLSLNQFFFILVLFKNGLIMTTLEYLGFSIQFK